MKKFGLIIFNILAFMSHFVPFSSIFLSHIIGASSAESPYHGYIKELEILNYNRTLLSAKLDNYLEQRNERPYLQFLISTKYEDFYFCMKTIRHEQIFNLTENYYFDGIICSDANIKAHGFIHEGVFFGRIEKELEDGSILKHVFSDITYVKDTKQRSKGHSVFYTSDQLDHEFLQKNIIRHHHQYEPKRDDDDDDIKDIYKIKVSKSNKNNYKLNSHNKQNDKKIGHSFLRSSALKTSKVIDFTKNICTLHVDFHPSYVGESRTVFTTLLEVITMFESINKVYAKNFQENGQPMIQYVVSSYRLLSGDDLTSMNSHLPAVKPALDHYNTEKRFQNKYCGSLFLTHTNWAQTLGMARVGNSKGVGICGNNAGTVVTSLLMGNKLDVLTIENTIIHELGHNLGANHDPVAECTKGKCASQQEIEECSPGGKLGMFIMYYSSNTGAFPNNNQFSPCSKREIVPLLKEEVRRKCLIDTMTGICGNGVIEKGEVCDSGKDSDGCCQMSTEGGKTPCTLIENKKCSPSMGSCCTAQCEFAPSSKLCAQSSDCAGSSQCNGSSATCPAPSYSPKNTMCARNTKGCNGKGFCNISLCQVNGKMDCDCDGSEDECVICCKDGDQGKCAPLNHNGKPKTYKMKGELCKSGKGLCSDERVCLEKIDDAGFSAFWMKLMNGESLTEVTEYVTKHLPIVGGVVGGALVLIIIIACIFKKDTSQYLKKKYDNEQRKLESLFHMSSQPPKNNKEAKKKGKNETSSHQNFDVSNSANFNNFNNNCNNFPPNMNQMNYNPNFQFNPMQNNVPNGYGSQQFMGPNNPQYGTNSMYYPGNMPQMGNFQSQYNYPNSMQQMNMSESGNGNENQKLKKKR